MWYFRTPDGERFPVDEKVQIVVEGVSHPAVRLDAATGSKALVLDVYDADWRVGDGTVGDDDHACKILVLEDSFSGARIEVPIETESADQLAAALAKSRKRGLRLRA